MTPNMWLLGGQVGEYRGGPTLGVKLADPVEGGGGSPSARVNVGRGEGTVRGYSKWVWHCGTSKRQNKGIMSVGAEYGCTFRGTVRRYHRGSSKGGG